MFAKDLQFAQYVLQLAEYLLQRNQVCFHYKEAVLANALKSAESRHGKQAQKARKKAWEV